MNTALIELDGHRAAACIRKGQFAWGELKATAEEQRTLWLEVGVALMYGKDKNNRPGKKFSDWVQEKFPGLGVNDAADAIWLAEDFTSRVKNVPVGISHPKGIRTAFNKQQALMANTDPILRDASAPTARPTLSKSIGQRVAKLFHRSQTKDEGSPIAAKAIAAYAKQHGLKEEELIIAAQEAAPDEFFRFDPPVQRQLDFFRATLVSSVEQMRAQGIPPEAIRAIYIQLANNV